MAYGGKKRLKNNHADYEDNLLRRSNETAAEGVLSAILADRGFGNTRLFALMDDLNFGYVIRLRGNIYVADQRQRQAKASEWTAYSKRIP